MHKTGFAIMECFESRVPKFSDSSQALYAQFIIEAEAESARPYSEEAEVKSFEERWTGPSGFLGQHEKKLEALADFTDEHLICERHAINYVMELLRVTVRQELRGLRSVFEMVVSIRESMELRQAS
jgi:hypothetical protein